MPRKKKEEVWKHFLNINNKSTKCKYCEKLYQVANVNKMEKHLQSCFKSPAVVKNEIKTLNTIIHDHRQDDSAPCIPSLQPQLSEIAATSSAQSTQTFEISEEKKKYLDQLISKAIFVSGAPMAMVEHHPLWIKFFEELQPHYKLPSRKAIATTHLEAIYKTMASEITEELRSAPNLHLQCDGWSNQRMEGIFNFIIAKPEPVFVKSLNTLSNRHTSQYLSDEILKVINNYDAHKFATLIGDNANNIQKAFDLVRNTYPHILPLRCVAHTLNLLCEDCLKPDAIKAFVKIVVDTIKTIKRSQVLTALLSQIIKEKGSGESLKLPVKTLWGSYYNAFKSVLQIKVALQTLAVHEEARLASEVKAHLLDETFWSMAESCVKLLEPISEKIFKLEGNKNNIHEVYMSFKDILSALNFVMPNLQILDNSDKKQILSCAAMRMQNCLKPIHFATYMLHPRSQGIELNENEIIESLEFLDGMDRLLNIDIMPDLVNYRVREGFWGKPFIWRNVTDLDPVVWWKGICASRPISKLAIRLLTAPCTSAATERSFSTLGHIHSAKRNRLTSERAAKISYVSYNWNLLKKYENEIEDEVDISISPSISSPMTSPLTITAATTSPNLLHEPSTSQEIYQNFDFFNCYDSTSDSTSD